MSHVEAVPPSHTCFLVVASDGLWDVITEERAAGLIIKVRKGTHDSEICFNSR